MWTDTRNCVPLEDGEYYVQTVYGKVTTMSYTHEAGWNTHYDSEGNLCDRSAIEDLYVVRWFSVPKPKAVPTEWMDEYWEDYKRKEKANEVQNEVHAETVEKTS